MRILKINSEYRSRRYQPIKRDDVTTEPSTNFTGKTLPTKGNFLPNLKPILSKIALLFLASPAALSTPKHEESEKLLLFLELNTLFVEPKMFFELYDTNPEFARIIAKSKRPINRYEIEEFCALKDDEYQFSKAKTEAAKHLINAQNKENKYLISWDSSLYYANTLSEDEAKTLNNKHETINSIFNNLKAPERKDHRIYLTLISAITLADSDNKYEFNIEEYERLGRILPSIITDRQKFDAWSRTKDAPSRNKILDKIQNNKDFSRMMVHCEENIVPNKDLLDKLNLFEENGLLNNIYEKIPPYLLNANYTVQRIASGIEAYNTLPESVQSHIRGSVLADTIITFDPSKSDNKRIDINDILELAKIFANVRDNEFINIFNNLLITYLPPIKNNETKAYITQNLKLLNSVRGDGENHIEDFHLKFLFNPKSQKNYENILNILEETPQILSELKLKCANTYPTFVKKAAEFLENHENIPVMAVTPNLDKQALINTLFQISKIEVAIAKNPAKYMFIFDTGVDKEYQALKTYLGYRLKSPEEAGVYLDSLSEKEYDFITECNDYSTLSTTEFRGAFQTIAITDAEYTRMLLDRGREHFCDGIYDIAKESYETCELINYLMTHTKNIDSNGNVIKLSGKQKSFITDTTNILVTFPQNQINDFISANQTMLKNNKDFIFDFQGFKKNFNSNILETLGISDKKEQEKALEKWDLSYLYLIPQTGDTKLAFDLLTKGNFSEYIHNPSTKHGKANNQTRQKFKKLGINYNLWLKGINPGIVVCGNKNYSISLLDRNDPNNLFIGNYTTCCTALGRMYGESSAKFMLNTAYNIIGIKDSNDNIVSAARIFIGETRGGEAKLVIDNIEVSNELKRTLNTDEEESLALQIWNYITTFSKQLSRKKLPIIMTETSQKIQRPLRYDKVEILGIAGTIASDEIYLNCVGENVDPKEKYNCTFLIID